MDIFYIRKNFPLRLMSHSLGCPGESSPSGVPSSSPTLPGLYPQPGLILIADPHVNFRVVVAPRYRPEVSHVQYPSFWLREEYNYVHHILDIFSIPNFLIMKYRHLSSIEVHDI